VLANLLANALEHDRAGEEIRVAVEPAGEGDGVRVSVADRGPGVPEHLREAVFEKYSRGESRRSGALGNQGLGLTFCKLAVEAHGGRIWVEPRPGGGSRFCFELPKEPAPPGGPAGERASREADLVGAAG
jgi:signal transduction histidine kinase